MKQKNLVLMVVAVGCGLVAAFLTANMNAKPAVPDQWDVLVATKDLPVGTFLAKDDLDKMVKTKKLPKDALPPALVLNKEDLADRRLTRPIRAEEWFNQQDLTKNGLVTLPEGKDMLSVSVNIEQAVSGFVGPGSRVDLLASVRKAGDRMIAFPLLVNMLVMAVDDKTQVPEGNGTFKTVSTISLAVDREEALLIHLAKQRSVLLSLVLRQDQKKKDTEDWNPEKVLRLLEGGDGIEKGGKKAAPAGDGNKPDPDGETPAETPKKVETVKIPVAKEDLPAGTMITEDLIKDKFIETEVPAPGPANAVTNLNEFINRHLTAAVAENQWVPKKAIGVPDPKPEPREGVTQDSKPAPTAEPVKPVEIPKPNRKTHDVVVQSTNGTRVFRYEEVTPGEWKYAGEVNKDGGQAAAPAAEAPKAEPARPQEPKADETPRPVRPNVD